MSQGPAPGQCGDRTNARSWNAGDVFGRTFFGTLAFCVLTGLIAGNVGVPIIGTIFGVGTGLAFGIPVSLALATVVTVAARPSVGAKAYLLSVDITLAILVIAAVALAIIWINQHALVGPRSPIAMLVVVALGAIGARPLLRRIKRRDA
jgi:hypothetical protein